MEFDRVFALDMIPTFFIGAGIILAVFWGIEEATKAYYTYRVEQMIKQEKKRRENKNKY